MANTKVTSGVIKDDAVGADQLASNSVVTASINDNAITTAKIADDAILTAKISNSAITNAKMSANSVDSDQYVDASIDTAHIRDAQVTSAKLDTNISISGELTVGSHLNMGDNDILKIGAGSDLQLSHDGSNSFIKDTGTGVLDIATNGTEIQITKNSAVLMGKFVIDGAAELYYAGAKKFETTSSGVTVTGDVFASGGSFFVGNGGIVASDSTSRDLKFGIGNTTAKMTLDTSGNVGIGTTSPYTPLEVAAADSIIRLTVTGGVADKSRYEMRAIGASGYEGLQFRTANDANNSYNVLMHLDYDGNLGIGTSSPNAKLELNVPTGDGLLIGSADIATIKMKNVGGAVKNWGFATTNLAASDFGIYQSNSNGGDPITAGSPKIYFNGLGKVGIGATSIDSDSLVHLKSNIPNIFFEDTDDNQDWRLEATSVFKLQDVTRGAEVFRIDSSGNVGIGQTSPYSHASFSSLSLGGTSSKGGLIQIKHSDNAAKGYLYAQADAITLESVDTNIVRFVTNAAERMRIDTNGKLLIGVTSFSDSGGGTEIRGSLMKSSADATSTHTHNFFTNSNGAVGSIQTNGSATQFNTSSDSRLKDITGEARGLEVINKLNPVAYNWKADGNADEGLIAQEVMEIVPNAVSQNEEDVYYQMDYSKLVTPLIKAIQELSAEVEELKAKLEDK
jgi:hypothetical protein